MRDVQDLGITFYGITESLRLRSYGDEGRRVATRDPNT